MERHGKVPERLPDPLSILFCLDIMSIPSFGVFPHRFVVF